MEIFVVTMYDYCTYSYSGIEPYDQYYFSSRSLAEEYIKNKGCSEVEYVKDPDKEMTLDVAKLDRKS